MKRRAKRGMLALAAAVLAGSWLVTGYMLELDRKGETAPAEADVQGYDLSVGTQRDMTALSWAWDGETYDLRRNARGRWENAQDAACPVDNAAAGALARAAASVTASRAIEHVTEFSQYGLDEPRLTVLAAAEDAIVTYEIGNAAITGEYYLRVDGGDTVYMENGGLAAAFCTDMTALLETERLPGDIAAVTGLTVKTDAGQYALRYEEGRWRRTDDGGAQPLEEGPVRALYEPVLALELTDCAGWDVAEKCGFAAPQGTATVAYTDERGADGAFTLEFGDYDGRSVFVRFEGSGLVYRVPAAVLDALMYPDWDAMLPLRALSFDPAALTSFTVTRGGRTYQVLCLRETEGGETVYSSNGGVLDAKRVGAWLEALADLTAEGVTSSVRGRAELFSLTLTEAAPAAEEEPPEGEEPTEPEETAGPAETPEPTETTLTLWRYDSAHALLVTGGRGLLLPRETAEELAEELDGWELH